MLEAAFWLSVGVVLWTYLGYPLVMGVKATVLPRPLASGLEDFDIHPIPPISIVLAVRNESQQLERRVQNLLDQEFGQPSAEIIVVINGSDDATRLLAAELARSHPRVGLVVSPAEEGKAGALNRGVAAATGEVVLFVDARQTFPPGSIRKLLLPFADPDVGAVTGRLVLPRQGVPSVRGVGTYWKLETRLRDWESASGSVVGSTGAIHAVRRRLYNPLPPQLILDDVLIPMRVVMAGHRVVRVKDATALDSPADGSTSEFRRKVRTLTGNIQLVRLVPQLLSPWRNPLFLRFVSHKMLRLVAPIALMLMLGAALFLQDPFYRIAGLTQLSFYALGVAGLVLPVELLSVPAGFLLLNAAAVVALIKGPAPADAVWHETRSLTPRPDGEPAPPTAEPIRVERREAS